jgi:Asp-tRNA(Asn)/Glu-tRNA(Gln) amidotransferase B subunit
MENKIEFFEKNLKKLINLISKYTYSMENHLKLLELDTFANNLIEEEPKIFESKYNELSKLNQFSYKMQLKIFTSYFIEKFFVYSQNNKDLISNQDIVTCYNITNNLTYFGKEKVFGFFVGQVMRAMKGKANPAVVNDLLKEQLTGP